MKFRMAILAGLMIGALACSSKNEVNPELAHQMPPKFLWAWERPEDLRFLDPKEFGVAFLTQTLFVNGEGIDPKQRRQPLEVAQGTYLIAVTRIETNRASHPTYSEDQRQRIVSLVKNTLELPDVKAVQIDFDAVVSERSFYRAMMKDLKQALPPETPLTMTSLASWCTGDAWFNDFPVDEAVPMAFQMAADDEKIKTFLRNGNDWNEPLCRGSYGISVEEGKLEGMKGDRRVYYFKNSSWTGRDLSTIQ